MNAAIFLLAAVATEPAPVILDAEAQMELTAIISKIAKEKAEAERNADYWYQQWKELKKKKGVCL